MKRMYEIQGREKLIECTHGDSPNSSRGSIVYVPLADLGNLPVSFDLLMPSKTTEVIISVWRKTSRKVDGGGACVTPYRLGQILMFSINDNLSSSKYLALNVEYADASITDRPIANGDHVFIRSIIPLSNVKFA